MLKSVFARCGFGPRTSIPVALQPVAAIIGLLLLGGGELDAAAARGDFWLDAELSFRVAGGPARPTRGRAAAAPVEADYVKKAVGDCSVRCTLEGQSTIELRPAYRETWELAATPMLTRFLFHFGQRSKRMPGRLTPEVEQAILQRLWERTERKNDLHAARQSTWNLTGSENHDINAKVGNVLASQIFMHEPAYATRVLPNPGRGPVREPLDPEPYIWSSDRTIVRLKDRHAPILFEAGRRADYRTLADFKRHILGNPIKLTKIVVPGHYSLTYVSRGRTYYFNAANTEIPQIDGKSIDYFPPRTFDSPYLQSDYGTGVVTVSDGRQRLTLDFPQARRR